MINYIARDIAKAPLKDVMLSVLSKEQFKSVLNLETHTREIIFGNGNDLFKACLYQKINLYDMAWSGIFPPSKSDVEAALYVLETAPKPIVFGCRAARERAGFLTAVYRMKKLNWNFDEAYSGWKREGCRFPTYLLWKRALKKIGEIK